MAVQVIGSLAERIGIVGSRRGADIEHVEAFVKALYEKQPHSVLVSGGADGVDAVGERLWLALGGLVKSFRPVQIGPEEYGIECWELGGPEPKVYPLINEPTFLTYASACIYRDLLIAEAVDRLVVFYAPGRSRGSAGTAESAHAEGKPVYEYERPRAEVR